MIEVLVYLALFGIIFGGSLSALYAIIESSDHNRAAAMVQEEGAFIIGKIDWILNHAQSIQSPVHNGSTLAVTEFDGPTATITRSHGNVLIQRGSNPAEVLNNANISIISLAFTHTNSLGNGIDPESIEVQMMIAATTSSGRILERDFYTIKYLRK